MTNFRSRFSKPVSPIFIARLEDEKKQKRLNDPLTNKEEFIEQFTELNNQLTSLVEEMRIYFARLYGINQLLSRAEIMEERLMCLEAEFIKFYKTEEVKDNTDKNNQSLSTFRISDPVIKKST